MTNNRRAGFAITLVTSLVFFNLITIDTQAQREAHQQSPDTPSKPNDNPLPNLVAGLEPQPSPELPAKTNAIVEVAKEKDSAAANELIKAKVFSSLQPLSLPDVSKLSPLDKAYLDAYSILREDNACSRFYGGFAAIEVLNQLTRQLKPVYLNKSIGLRMTGKISYAMNNTTKLSYRTFENAQLNTNGPFYRTSIFPVDSTIPRVGEYSPNTREARLTILLHELGHMIQRPDGEWVLPNDGDDPGTSRSNTQKVIEVCREQIKGQSHIAFDRALAVTQADRETTPAQLAAHTETTAPLHSIAKPAGDELLRQIGSQLDARCETCRREIQNPQDR